MPYIPYYGVYSIPIDNVKIVNFVIWSEKLTKIVNNRQGFIRMNNILKCLEITQILFKPKYGRSNDMHIYLSPSYYPLVESYNQN